MSIDDKLEKDTIENTKNEQKKGIIRVGIAGPMSLAMINFNWEDKKIPEVQTFPLISNIINELLERGIKVVAFTYSEVVQEPIIFEDEKITICVTKRSKNSGRHFFRDERKMLIEMMNKFAPDIINVQWAYEYALAALATGIPTIVTLRDHAWTIFRYFMDPYRFVKLLMNFIVMRKARYFTTNSEYLKNLMPLKQKNKAVVVNNFFDPSLTDYFSTDKLESKKIIAICNGFGKRKNVKNALKAFGLFRQTHKDYKLVLIGTDMQEGGPAYHYAIKHDIQANVEFLGYLQFDRVLEELTHSDILLHPALEESFGNTILEAMVVGTNVVGGQHSGNVPYLLDHGNVGVLCDVTSPTSISRALASLADKPDFSQDLRIKGHEFAIKHYSKDSSIQKLIDYYNYVLENEKKIRR
jgi:glycosyltransferase involved in cell wall biosynthesis